MWRMGVPVATPAGAGDVLLAVAALVGGAREAEAVEELSRLLEDAHVRFTGLGRTALYVGLRALKASSERDEVVVPAFVCPSVARAVVKAGLRVVLCDVDPAGFGLDPRALARLIGGRTLAVVDTHLYGYPVDLAPVLDLARNAGAAVVEDAAQAFGARMHGRRVGLAGRIGIYSFGMSKAVWGLGCGVVVTRDAELAEGIDRQIAALPGTPWTRQAMTVAKFAAVSGMVRSHHLGPIAKVWASSMRGRGDADDFEAQRASAAQTRVTARLARRVAEIAAVRRRNAERLLRGLRGVHGIVLPQWPAEAEPMFVRLPVIVEAPAARAELIARLLATGINASEMYDRPNFDLLRGFVEAMPKLPATEYLIDRMLNLPVHAFVEEREIDQAIAIVRAGARPGPVLRREACA